jgi:VanZ family protein
MMFFRRQQITALMLVIYWIVLIIFAHIPIPESVRQARVSDKSLHFLAYLVLTFLFWFTFKPNQKVILYKAGALVTFCIITFYGAIDEPIQTFFGRTCDVMDILANVSGTLAGLVLLSRFSYWPAALLITSAVIFGVTNIARKNIADVFPLVGITFDFFAYATFTFLWIFNMSQFVQSKIHRVKWLILAITIPVVFLLMIKTTAVILGRSLNQLDVLVSAGAIMTVAFLIYIRKLALEEL